MLELGTGFAFVRRQFPLNIDGDDSPWRICGTEQNRHKQPNNYKIVWIIRYKSVTEDLDAWNPNIRSKAAIRTSDTRHFVDPSIGTASLGLGPKDLINDGADALNTLADTIDTTKMKKPSFKMVLTAVGPYAYQRPDGIFVVPIGCLKD